MKRKDRILDFLLQKWKMKSENEIQKESGSSTSEIAIALSLGRANVSNDLNELVKNRELVKIKSYPIRFIPVKVIQNKFNLDLKNENLVVSDINEYLSFTDSKVSKKKDPFEQIIGYNRSLNKPISQAKSAVHYPPHGLHMLLLGPTGSGKTFFATKIYQYALFQNIFEKYAPFESFNCADYYNNPQLLISQLFGHAKGSYTGANEEHVGLVERANGGILFLDEVHRLPPEGQEMLFYFIDHGLFNRLGENGKKRTSKVLIICATTEDPNSTLLSTFQRRIPMIIQIPPLSERSIQEKVDLVKYLFSNEAKRVNRVFHVSADVINVLINFENYGNVGQLKSQVQLICAQSFLNSLYKTEGIFISIKDMPDDLQKQWITIGKNPESLLKLSKIIDVITTITPGEKKKELDNDQKDFNIYDLIEKKAKILVAEGVTKHDIQEYLIKDINFYVNSSITKSRIDYDLLKFVDPEISNLTRELKIIAEKELNLVFDHQFLYHVGLHLDAFFKNNESRQLAFIDYYEIKNQQYKEYQVVEKMANEINRRYKMELPEIEKLYLTMLIHSLIVHTDKKQVGILVAAHGNGTAKSIVEVTTELLGSSSITYIDIPLTVLPEEVTELLCEKVKLINSGKGVLLISDMGSLTMMDEKITQETGIEIKTIANLTTSLVLDAARKVNYMDINLDNLYKSMLQDFITSVQLSRDTKDKKRAVLSICISGMGTAKKLEKTIISIINDVTDEKIEVLTVSALDLESEISEINEKYAVVASVGSEMVSPNIPHITLESLINGEGESRIKKIILQDEEFSANDFWNDETHSILAKDVCKETLIKHLVYLNPFYVQDILFEWIKQLEISFVGEFSSILIIKLVVHTAFSFERVIKNTQLEYQEEKNSKLISIQDKVEGTLNTVEKKLNLFLTEDEKFFISEIIFLDLFNYD